MDNQQERLFNLGWIVGLLDGEGAFCLDVKRRDGKNDYYAPAIWVGNTKYSIIDKAIRFFREVDIPFYVYSKKLPSGKKFTQIRIYGLKRVKRFFDKIDLGYFECRKDQAEILLEYINLRLSKTYNSPMTDKEHDLALKLKLLNK